MWYLLAILVLLCFFFLFLCVLMIIPYWCVYIPFFISFVCLLQILVFVTMRLILSDSVLLSLYSVDETTTSSSVERGFYVKKMKFLVQPCPSSWLSLKPVFIHTGYYILKASSSWEYAKYPPVSRRIWLHLSQIQVEWKLDPLAAVF